MLRDITLGQYYPGSSWIHRLDPRVKILGTLLYIVTLFLVRDFLGFVIAIAFLALATWVSRVPLKFMLKGLKPVFLIIIFTFTVNMFMTRGTTLVEIGFLTITRELSLIHI